MVTLSGVVPQAFAMNPSVLTMLEDSWYGKPESNPVRVMLPSTEVTVRKLLLSAPTHDLEIEGSSWSAPTSGFEEECSTSLSDYEKVEQIIRGNGSGRCYSFDEAEIRAVFGMLDKDANGLISGEEWRQFMCIWGIDVSKAEAQSMIKSSDDNEDGGIDFNEFYSLYRTSLSGHDTSAEEEKRREKEDKETLTEAFRFFDKNSDGFISAQELQAVLLGLGVQAGKSLRQCQKMIANVDQDGNGQCDLHEFQSMMSAQPFLQKQGRSNRSN